MTSLLETWTGLSWLSPWMLGLAALVPLAFWFRGRRGEPSLRFAPGSMLEEKIPQGWRTRLNSLPRTFQFLGLCAVALALARPAQRVTLPQRVEGIEILLCLDVSSSMAARDLDTRRTRLEVAKEAASRFVEGRPEDRVGLISFARYPDLRCPPTLDHAALKEILSGVTMVESDGPEDATGIGTAVARAAQLLQGGEAKSKVVILLTDGDENVATAQNPAEIAPLHASQLCRERGVRVYAIAAGVGKEGLAASRAPQDTAQIRDLAQTTGGRFFAARDAEAMHGVYASIDALEKAPMEQERTQYEDRFLPFLLAGVALLLAGRFLDSFPLGALP